MSDCRVRGREEGREKREGDEVRVLIYIGVMRVVVLKGNEA